MNKFYQIIKSLCDKNGNLPEVLTVQSCVIQELTNSYFEIFSKYLDAQENLVQAQNELVKRNDSFIRLGEMYDSVLFEFENLKGKANVKLGL